VAGSSHPDAKQRCSQGGRRARPLASQTPDSLLSLLGPAEDGGNLYLPPAENRKHHLAAGGPWRHLWDLDPRGPSPQIQAETNCLSRAVSL